MHVRDSLSHIIASYCQRCRSRSHSNSVLVFVCNRDCNQLKTAANNYITNFNGANAHKSVFFMSEYDSIKDVRALVRSSQHTKTHKHKKVKIPSDNCNKVKRRQQIVILDSH